MFGAGRFSTRVYLLAFSLALVVPILLFGAWSILSYAQIERGRLERQTAQIARQLNVVLDTDVRNLLAMLGALASSSALLRDDLEDFHAQASRLAQQQDLLSCCATTALRSS